MTTQHFAFGPMCMRPLLDRALQIAALTTLALSALTVPISVQAQHSTSDDTAASRFELNAELRPVSVSANGRYTLDASARYTPEAKSSDGRFSLKTVNAPSGGCGSGIDDIFSNGFEN